LYKSKRNKHIEEKKFLAVPVEYICSFSHYCLSQSSRVRRSFSVEAKLSEIVFRLEAKQKGLFHLSRFEAKQQITHTKMRERKQIKRIEAKQRGKAKQSETKRNKAEQAEKAKQYIITRNTEEN
jgi:hypothetical protein